MSKFTKVIFALVFAVMLLPIEQIKAQFQTGDVFVAVSNGQVQWRNSNGTLVQTLNTTAGGFTTGMALDSANKLYVTNFSASSVSVFNKFGVLQGTFGSGYSTPESIVFDNQWNAYVGNLGNGIRKFDYNGNFLGTSFGGRVDFMDLQSDQCTMLRTTEGTFIGTHNVCTNVPGANFANGLSGNAFALRIRLNGDVLIAMGTNVLRLNAAGTTIQTYDVAGENSWFALNLDPDGTSFWSADIATANVYRIDIATGNVITTFNTGTPNLVFGLAVAGEITAATVLNIAVAPKNSIKSINTQHCVTATVTDQFAVPQDNVNVIFVVRGVNAPQNFAGNTDQNGQVQFCYTGTNPGRDTIFATIGTSGRSDTAYVLWEDPLPVELSSFTSSVSGSNVNLKWTTSEEINNAGFDIERSSNGTWTKVGNVTGNGTTNEIKNYEFTDRGVNSGTYNYRLKQIDYNGSFEYYNLSSEVIVGVPDKFSIAQNYPNPFNPSTTINFQIPAEGNVKLAVFDNSGKQVALLTDGIKAAGYYSINFNAADLSSGIYFYKIEYNGMNKVMKMTLLK